jgi:LysR family glycine cleavage system transcriptional activator
MMQYHLYMTIRLPSLSALRAFEAAARLRSFKKAADELAVTPTAISHRIRVLEEDLERRLFLRKVRAVDLTPDGQALFAAVSTGFQAIAAAVEHLRKPSRAAVTLSATPAFAAKWLVPRLAAFQAEHPGIDLHIHASTTPVDLNDGTADLAIRYGHGQYSGVAATLLLENSFAPVASPALAATLPRDSSEWPLIHFDWLLPSPAGLTWSTWARESGRSLPSPSAGFHYSEESHAIQAAVAGQGVALLSRLLIEDELRLGLLQVVAGPALNGLAYHLLRSSRRPASAAALAVEDWLVRTARECPRNSAP